jgi:hypothetical protein
LRFTVRGDTWLAIPIRELVHCGERHYKEKRASWTTDLDTRALDHENLQ